MSTALVYAYGDTVEAERMWSVMSGQAQVQYRDEAFLREVSPRVAFICVVQDVSTDQRLFPMNRRCGGPSGWCARWGTSRASTRRAGQRGHDS